MNNELLFSDANTDVIELAARVMDPIMHDMYTEV